VRGDRVQRRSVEEQRSFVSMEKRPAPCVLFIEFAARRLPVETGGCGFYDFSLLRLSFLHLYVII